MFVLRYERYHIEARSPHSASVLVIPQPRVEHKQRLVPVQDPAQEAYHLPLGRPLAGVVAPAAVPLMLGVGQVSLLTLTLLELVVAHLALVFVVLFVLVARLFVLFLTEPG